MRLSRLLCALLASMLIWGCNEDDGNPTGGGNNNPPSAESTSPGTANGAPATGTIGAAGGSLTSADGLLKIEVPAGALSADTEITIQSITNTAWGGVGNGYRLTPDGLTFASPVSLVFDARADLLAGSAPAFLDCAVQDDEGYWYVLKNKTFDSGEGTLTCQTSHFTDYSLIEGVQIRPAAATVGAGEQVALSIQYCHREPIEGDDELVALVYTCGDEILPLGTFTDWSVNGVIGGTGTYGTVVEGASAHLATYTAPPEVPNPNTVAVSVQATYQNTSELLVSNITIEEEWVGTTTVDYTAFLVNTTVTWKLLGKDGTRSHYYPTGSVTVTPTVPDCKATLDPNTHAIADSLDGILTVDYATDPPTFEGVGETSWNATFCVTCPPEGPFCTPYLAGGAWFFASGEVSPDGKTISGTADIGGAPLTFSFSRP